MKKKEIRFLYDVQKSDFTFKKGMRYEVKILQYMPSGYINRYPEDSTIEGALFPTALVEFENGKVMHFAIDSEIHIIGDAE